MPWPVAGPVRRLVRLAARSPWRVRRPPPAPVWSPRREPAGTCPGRPRRRAEPRRWIGADGQLTGGDARAYPGLEGHATGASRGIGRAIAERLARDGARVAVHYGSDEAAAKETLAAIESAGGSAFALRTELGVPGGDAEVLWEAFGRQARGVDILVNNAGMAIFATMAETDETMHDRTQAVNARALPSSSSTACDGCATTAGSSTSQPSRTPP